jgi:2,5-diamino-6-(ribosylamino)-4(3H)-pyrimidinone 5'-phosphate reductase
MRVLTNEGSANILSQRLFPAPCEEVEEIYEDVEFPDLHPRDPDLPYVVINMVSSVDGRTSADGRSGSIGGNVDRGVMRTLRSKVDAVAVGAGTVRAERVSMISDGLTHPEPKAVLITSSLNLPVENFSSVGKQEKIILTTDEGLEKSSPELRKEISEVFEIVSLPANPDGKIDLGASLRTLKIRHGINKLLLEGGPATNNEMVKEGLAAEIFMTMAPKLLGETEKKATGILSGKLSGAPVKIELSSVHLSNPDGELFLRYEFRDANPPMKTHRRIFSFR